MSESRIIPPKEIQRLVARGEKQGYLTPEDIFAVVSTDLVEELDDLVAQLQRRKVVIVDNPEEGSRLVKQRREQSTDTSASDALSSYLREISQLPTLDRETEIQYANEYRSGISRAMRAVVDARLFGDQLSTAAFRIRQGKAGVWDVVDRLRFSREDDPETAETMLLKLADEVAALRREEKRIRSQLARRGVKPDKAAALSDRLSAVRNELSKRIQELPYEAKFMKSIASNMMAIHARLARADKERGELAARLDTDPQHLNRTLRTLRRSPQEAPVSPDEVAEVDRRHRNLKRRIRRIEKQAGMSFEALQQAVLRYRSGILQAQQARDALILSAQRLVLSSARYYGRRLGGSGMEVADLISAGNLGLIRAVELFDPDRGNRFSTFAGHWVRHAMIRTIHTQSRTVYVPPHIRQQMSKILAMENELIQRHGRSPSDQELANASDLEIPKLRHTIQSFGRMSSIDRPLDPGDAGSATYGDILADERATPDEALEGAERREIVRSLAERLQGRERTIVFMRMGWDNQEPKTLAEIGDLFGISRQRVEQLEKRALGKLRRWARATGLGDRLVR